MIINDFQIFQLGLIAVRNDFQIFELGLIAVQIALALLPWTSIIKKFSSKIGFILHLGFFPVSSALGGTKSSFQNLFLGTSLDPGWLKIQTPSPWDTLNIYVVHLNISISRL